MNNKYTENGFNDVVDSLCQKVRMAINKVPENFKEQIHEIRLRSKCPLTIVSYNNIYFVKENGTLSKNIRDNLIIINNSDILETFQNMCKYSVYSYQNEINEGYITIRSGHRVGICGTAVLNDNKITSVKDISSLNIRISRQIKNIGYEVINNLTEDDTGLLLVGPPSSGKTTLLRDISRILSNGIFGEIKKVTIIDERAEIAASFKGIPQNDVGTCDVLTGYPKGKGIMLAIRSLSPEIIICDEIGSLDDIKAIEEGLNAGVKIISSIHASSLNELVRRKQANMLLQTGAFSKVILLHGKENPCKIKEVHKVGDYNAKNSWSDNSDFIRQPNGIYGIA